MRSKNSVVTGTTSGIGKVAALELARRGASVVIVGRDQARGAAALAELRAESGNEAVALELADLASQASVRRLAEAIARRFPALLLLINNAGVVEPRARKTSDSIEATLAINHLAPFLLTNLLLEQLEAGQPAGLPLGI